MPALVQVVNVTPRYAKLRSNDRQVKLASFPPLHIAANARLLKLQHAFVIVSFALCD